jgi:hypothetical protein
MKPSDEEKVAESTPESSSRVPDTARVPKPAVQPGLLSEEGPLRITPSARARAKAKLRDVTERIRSGDNTDLRALRHGGFGKTTRELAACNHYLPANRFEWWDVVVPWTQAIGSLGADPNLDLDQIFYSEFCSPLSTVVGADLHAVDSIGARTAITWDPAPDGASPNSLPSIEFSVRTLHPGSVPVIKEVEVILGPDERVGRKVLINAVEAGHDLDPTQTRPSLFIDFFVPQRAVGLECGFLGEEDREMNPQKVTLIARDSGGEVLVESRGDELLRIPWRANAVFYRIGVRHREGAIRSIELRFGDLDEVILEPQIVYRIWHEPLPPAAVMQGTAALEFDPNPSPSSDEDHVIRVPPHDGPLGPITITLPFRCDRAVVMMRGFKMFFLDQQPHKVRQIGAIISDSSTGHSIFRTDPGGRITLVPSGLLTSAETHGYRMLIYYLVLAWSSDQMELLPLAGYQRDQTDSGGLLSSKMTLQDPCHRSHSACEFPGSVLGPLSGSLGGFSFTTSPAQEVGLLGLHMGIVGGSKCVEPSGGGFTIRGVPFERPSLHRNGGGTITWEFCTDFYDVSQSSRATQGTVLIGRSLRIETTDDPTIIFGPIGGRDPNDPFLFTTDIWDRFAQPISADMAFLSLGQFIFEPSGEIRELEVEVHGREYDGEIIKWQLGAGISVSPPISSGGKRAVFGWPAFGGVVRRTIAADIRLAVQHLSFHEGIRESLSFEPDQYGAIRNTGNVPVLLTSATRRGPQADEFNFLIDDGGDIVREDALVARAPLVLHPGQTLTIGGVFFPQVDAGPNDPPRYAWCDFATNIPEMPIVRIEARGRTIPPQPHGAVLPTLIDFGFVHLHASNDPQSRLGFPTRNVLLISDGQTPLLIRSLGLDDDALGFSFGIRDPGLQPEPLALDVPYQIDAGGAMVIEVQFVPVVLGLVETQLVALTNSGRLETRLRGEGHT